MPCRSWNSAQNRWDDYLVALFGLSDGRMTQWATHVPIAQESGIPLAEIMGVGLSVRDQNYAKFMTLGSVAGHVAITAAGTRRAEQIITERERSVAAPISGSVVLSAQDLQKMLEQVVVAFQRELDTHPNS